MQQGRRNREYVADLVLPELVTVTAELPNALAEADAVVLAVPSHGFRDVVVRAAPHIAPGTLVVSVVKGLERGTGMRMSEILGEELGDPKAYPVAVLSGPNLSAEIAQGMPAVSVAASADPATAQRVQALFNSNRFRVYRNCDIIGVELSGALKNVVAVGTGISDGLGFGDNAKAAVITRGLAEIGRLGMKLGAEPTTFWGIAGVGDLVTTCNSRLSRNWQVGWRMARGETLNGIQDSTTTVAEGIYTTAAAREMARKLETPTPVTDSVYRVLFEGASPADEVEQLMSRPLKAERESWQMVGRPVV
jgi:glycerol-3-phosphate dehydrogenase (NAD(P)+)